MEIKTKNREWVKNAAIIFLAVLLVLTFFSNTWMNRSLPEVATQAVTSGSITAKVRGTGTVTAIGNHQVKAPETREIRAVMVKVGQEVSPGDVLFVLGQGEASELEQAQEKLRSLQISYQRAAAGGPYGTDYSAYQTRIDLAQFRLEEAQDAYDEAYKLSQQGNDDTLLEETQRHLDLAIKERDRLLQELNNPESLEERIHDKETELNDAQSDLASAQSELSTSQSDLAGKQASLAEKQRQKRELEQQLAAIESAGSSTDEDAPEGVSNDNTLSKEELEKQISSLNDEIASINDDINSSTTDVSSKQSKVDSIANEVNKLQAELDGLMSKSEDLDEAQAEVDKWESRYYNVITASGGGYSDAYRLARDNLFSAKENLQSAKAALEEKMNSDAQNAAYTGIELMDLAQQIEIAKAKLESLSGGVENEITANVSGTVQSIECTAGDTMKKNDILCTIEVPDMGHTLSFSVTNDQARRLRVGDKGSVSNYYWGNQINCTLTTIQTDPKNPQNNKLLTFDLEGDVNTGAELTISVGQKSASYDTVIPNSSIRSDTNGSFVLMVESRSSPLGNRYVARRVNVEVLAADDNNSAVTADLNYGDYVITTSSAPIKSGDLVRLADA